MGLVIQSELNNISDIVKSEGDSLISREERTILAADRATLSMGHIVELSSTSVTAQKAGGTTHGICVSKAPTNLLKATQYLDIATAPTDTDTVIIGAKTYTFQTVLTNVDGNVLIGASAATALQNLVAAINGTVGTGTEWAAATVKNTQVDAVLSSATRMQVIAITAGSVGNAIATTETLTDATDAWVAATLTGGQGTEPTKCVVMVRDCVVDKNNLNYGAGVVATVDTALTALGIIGRAEPTTLEVQPGA
jgi:hypothetical protein